MWVAEEIRRAFMQSNATVALKYNHGDAPNSMIIKQR